MPLSESHPALQNRISGYISALRNEIEALKNFSSRNHLVSSGRFLGTSDTEFLYEFKLDEDSRMSDEVPVEIEVDGEATRGSIIAVETGKIMLLLQSYVGETVEQATLHTAPYFLLEQLIERLEGIDEKNVECVEALFDEDKNDEHGQDLSIDPKDLNEFQVEAAQSLLRRRISYVWGPPGTGKTRTLAYTAANLVGLGENVLVISNTNIAVDVALQKTLEYLKDEDDYFNGKFVRFGIPRLVELEDFPWSIPQYVARDKSPALYATIEKIEMDIRGTGAHPKKSKSKPGQKKLSDLREKLAVLREEAYGKESRIVQHANLVACTAAKMAIASQVFSRRFDAVLIDEASMLYLPYVAFAASLARKRVAIFGDFMQIPPITQSSTRILGTLSKDIFREAKIHRNIKLNNPRLSVLEIQYRMPVAVMDLVNDRIYSGRLKASEKIKKAEPKNEPVAFYDTSTLNSKSFREANSNSRINILSGIAAIDIAVDSLKRGAKSVGIITPYRAQARYLRSILSSMSLDASVISAATVHTFQGNERDIIVFDFVDDKPLPLGVLLSSRYKNNDYDVGEDEDISEGERLLNVAITRTRKRLLFIGNFDYLSARSAEGSLLRFVLDKLKREKVVSPIVIKNKNEKAGKATGHYIGENISGLSIHLDHVQSVVSLMRDIQESTEELKLVQPVKAKLQFFKYVMNKEVETSKEFKSLDIGVIQEKLKHTNLITSDKSDLFFWVVDGKKVHVFDILDRISPSENKISGIRISIPEVAKVFGYILPRKNSRLTGTGGKDVDVHCAVCGGKLELREMKGMIVARCADNDCITVAADGKIIEAILEENGESCPIDAGKIRIKRGRRGFFVGCANYPACTWTAELGEILK